MTWSTVFGILLIIAVGIVAMIILIAAVAAAVKATRKPERCPHCGQMPDAPAQGPVRYRTNVTRPDGDQRPPRSLP